MRHATRVGSIVIPTVALAAAGCFMTAEEGLWRDAAREQPAHDVRGPDIRPRDATRLEGALGDGTLNDGALTDGALADGTKPDGTKPDGKQPDAGKTDAGCGQMILSVTAADDEGMVYGGNFMPDGWYGTVEMGYWTPNSVWAYFRFTLSSALPASAKISSATVSLYATTTDSWVSATHALEVWLENAADAATVTSGSDEPFTTGGRTLTGTAVRWPASGGLDWTLLQYHTTPSVGALLQSVVAAKGGLSSGSHVQVWVRGAQIADAETGTPSYTSPGYSTHPARLTINWCP